MSQNQLVLAFVSMKIEDEAVVCRQRTASIALCPVAQSCTVRAGDALMNRAALSQRKPTSSHCRHHNCIFPLSLQPSVQRQTQSHDCCDPVFFFLRRQKCSHHYSHVFRFLLHYRDKHVLRLPQTVFINEKEKKKQASAFSCFWVERWIMCLFRHVRSPQED